MLVHDNVKKYIKKGVVLGDLTEEEWQTDTGRREP